MYYVTANKVILFFLFLTVLEIELRGLCILDKCFSTELYIPSNVFVIYAKQIKFSKIQVNKLFNSP